MDERDRDAVFDIAIGYLNELTNTIKLQGNNSYMYKTSAPASKAYEPKGITVEVEPGLTITGTKQQVLDTVNKLGLASPTKHLDGFYWSQSKGLTIISEMATAHIRNALLVEYRKWIDDLRGLSDTGFINTLKIGAGTNSTIQSLAQELSNRKDKGLL